jgi:hypothetical protein
VRRRGEQRIWEKQSQVRLEMDSSESASRDPGNDAVPVLRVGQRQHLCAGTSIVDRDENSPICIGWEKERETRGPIQSRSRAVSQSVSAGPPLFVQMR